jgi:hypothetical protein
MKAKNSITKFRIQLRIEIIVVTTSGPDSGKTSSSAAAHGNCLLPSKLWPTNTLSDWRLAILPQLNAP